jgi:HEAT repeat protein
MGVRLVPRGHKPPPGFENDPGYRTCTGSIVKFEAEGGAVINLNPKNPKPPEDRDGIILERRAVRGPGLTYGGATRAGLAFAENALAVYPGLGCLGGGYGDGCPCRQPMFTVDGWGRIFYPSAFTCSVRVVDNSGNEILSFGQYGNADSGGPGSRIPVPPVPLAWPEAVSASYKAIYVSDPGNWRVVRMLKKYGAEASAPVAKPSKKAREILQLGASGKTDKLDAVWAAIQDEDPGVRSAGIRVFGALTDITSFSKLVPLLATRKDDRDRAAVEKAILAACRRLKDKERCSAPALAALNGASLPVRRSLLRVLGTVGGAKAIGTLHKACTDPDRSIQEFAVSTMAACRDRAALDPLLDLLGKVRTNRQRAQVLDGYLSLLDRAATMPAKDKLARLEAALNAVKRRTEKEKVLMAMRGVRDPKSFAVLKKYYKTKLIGRQAMTAAIIIADQLKRSHWKLCRRELRKMLAATRDEKLRAQVSKLIKEIELSDVARPKAPGMDEKKSADDVMEELGL